MPQLWKKDLPPARKWLISLFLLVMLGALVPVFHRSFIPTVSWQKTALVLSVLLTLATMAWLWSLHRQGLWRPEGPWLTYGPLKRLLMTPLCLAFVILMLWLDIAITLPVAYTQLVHEQATRSATVQKKRGTGRRSCRHQLEITQQRFIFFEFCLDKESFEALPDGALPAQLAVRRSIFGEEVDALHLAVPR